MKYSTFYFADGNNDIEQDELSSIRESEVHCKLP